MTAADAETAKPPESSLPQRVESTHAVAASTQTSRRRQNKSTRIRQRVIWIGRAIFVVILLAVAAMFGYAAHTTLQGAETDLAETQYDSMASRALNEAAASFKQRRSSASTMSAIASEQNPAAASWPFVAITGFQRIARNLLSASSTRDIGFLPLVRRRQQAEFEEFAYDYYSKTASYPDNAGETAFGKGIWTLDSENQPFQPLPDAGEGDDEDDLVLPVFQSDYNKHLMMNLYRNEVRVAMDLMLSCARQRSEAYAPANGTRTGTNETDLECATMTSIFELEDRRGRFAALLLYPIFPADDPTTLTGAIATVVAFEELLVNIFSDEVTGIDCVVTTEHQAVTFAIRNGVAELVSADDDAHDPFYNDFSRRVILTNVEGFHLDSPIYTLYIYPTDDFYEVYSTNNPKVAVAGIVSVIIFMCFVFALYDFFVRREFNARRDLLQAKRQFMRFVSHEVRTPLNSVYMGLQLLKSELSSCIDSGLATVPSNMNKEAANTEAGSACMTLEWFMLTQEIQANVQGAVDVLNDLLNYDKIEQSSLQLDLSLFSVCKTIEQSFNEFKLPTKQKKLRYELQFDPTERELSSQSKRSTNAIPRDMKLLQLHGDSVRIAQVLRNLISNAMKFTPEGGSLRIRVRWVPGEEKDPPYQDLRVNGDHFTKVQPAGELELHVQDSGAGMTPSQVDKLFSDGVQFNVNQLQSGKGSGLGLYIAKGIVEQHGGSLEATSRGLGFGTTFTMTLPLWNTQSSVSDDTRSIASESESEEEEKPSFHVLVVDDVKSNRKLLSRLLRNEGHTCEEAENGQEAIDKFQQAAADSSRYDAIVMDYEMPIMNGPEAAKRIRELDERVHIAGVTGNILADDVQYFKACGANVVLPKPLKLVELEASWFDHGLLALS